MTANLRPAFRIRLRPDDVLFYLHIPKTAGISLISVLEANFKPDEIFELHSIPPKSLGGLEIALPVFRELSPDQIMRIRLIRGHFRFGPYDGTIYRYIVQNPILITMLRDPVDRTISAYRHLLRNPDGVPEFTGEGVTLEEYACDPRYFHRVYNRQTRMLVGAFSRNMSHEVDSDALSDNTLLLLAKQRLEQCAFFGLTERFEQSLQLLTHTFDWPPVESIPVLNTSPQPSRRDTISRHELEAIEAVTEQDRELYHFAVRLFDERIKALQSMW